MGTTVKWLGKAILGLRTFAYGSAGERPKVGVALGGGFARGIAHIGVLRVLEEHEIAHHHRRRLRASLERSPRGQSHERRHGPSVDRDLDVAAR